MGFFSRIREGLRSIRERLVALVTRKEIPPEARKEIQAIEKRVERIEREVRPQEQIVAERFEPPEPPEQRYHVLIQYRPVTSLRKYTTFEWTGEAESLEEAIAFATEELTEEPDYFLAIESRSER